VYSSYVATSNIDLLVGKLRKLSPEEIAQVEALVERLEPANHGGFAAFSGVLSQDDAKLMADAVADCDRIDPSGW
jgi:hypothetical protein